MIVKLKNPVIRIKLYVI